MLKALGSLVMNALVIEGPTDPLDYDVLLRAGHDDLAVDLQGALEFEDHLSCTLPSNWFDFLVETAFALIFWHAVQLSRLRKPREGRGATVRTAL